MITKYREARIGDLSEIELLIRQAYKPIADLLPRPPGALVDTHYKLEQTLKSKQLFIVYNEEDKLIGTFSLSQTETNIIKIFHFAIKPEFQKQGIGSWLIEEIIRYLKTSSLDITRIELEIYAKVPQLKYFYEKFGFKEKERKYIRGVEIVVLVRDLKPVQSSFFHE
ncbi:MAG: GNAT family N-acetyltransferase [Candidatus Hodarchaeota archaeon]